MLSNSTGAIPPGHCGIHGYHGRTACPKCSTSALPFTSLIQSVSAAVSPAEPPERELTEYEKGYLDGVLAYAYRGDGEVYVGKNRLTTYEAAALRFLKERGIEGWSVNVR